jgi:hypothetical protein
MKTLDRAKLALWKKAGLPHDGRGYLSDPQMNLVNGLTADMIRADYEEGNGKEWLVKFRAIHSSAALAANTFGRWKSDPMRLKFAGMSGFGPPKLEAKCPTGLPGAPPNLDVLLQTKDTVIGVESKLLEPLTAMVPEFPSSYSLDRLPHCDSVWWSLLEQTRIGKSSHFDVAQLIKHYLGLRKQYPGVKNVVLIYLFWLPLNACKFLEYSRHAEDLKKFQIAVQGSEAVQFIPLDYLQLWDTWERDLKMAEHAKLLKQRYCVEI